MRKDRNYLVSLAKKIDSPTLGIAAAIVTLIYWGHFWFQHGYVPTSRDNTFIGIHVQLVRLWDAPIVFLVITLSTALFFTALGLIQSMRRYAYYGEDNLIFSIIYLLTSLITPPVLFWCLKADLPMLGLCSIIIVWVVVFAIFKWLFMLGDLICPGWQDEFIDRIRVGPGS